MLKTIRFIFIFFLSLSTSISFANPPPKHFPRVMVIMFENMSYPEIKDEPTFKKLVEYSGNTLDAKGRLIKLNLRATRDTTNNGYAFFSSYYNNHEGGIVPSRTSQPNYIALTSGSVHGIHDNEMYDLNVDNLSSELNDANIDWKIYAEDLPDASATNSFSNSGLYKKPLVNSKTFVRDPNKSEQENDIAEHAFLSAGKTQNTSDYNADGCFVGSSHVDGQRGEDDGYMRKHEPLISYLNVQNSYENCKRLVNSKHLVEDIDNNKMPAVALFVPNQVHDGHNGELQDRIVNANKFLSEMMGTNPTTGAPLPNAKNAPFQKFMAQGGLLVITFDEPSTVGNPNATVYTLFAGKMIKSGAYPTASGKDTPICYPSISKQSNDSIDLNGKYNPLHCNHYNLLKMIEDNFQLRGLAGRDTSMGYKYALPIDNSIPMLWSYV